MSTPPHFGLRSFRSMQAETAAECARTCPAPLCRRDGTSQRRAGSAVRVSRAEHTASRRVRPTSSLCVGIMSVRPASPRCNGSVSRFADGESKPPPRPTRACTLRATDGSRTCQLHPAKTCCERVMPCCQHARASHPLHRCAVRALRAPLRAARTYQRKYLPTPPSCSTICLSDRIFE